MSFPRYPEYKDSGVAWLGEVPAHWEMTPLKRLADFVNGDAFKPTDWAESGIPIIRIQNLNGGDDFNYFDGAVEERYLVREGDLLFGWSGNRGTSFGPFVWRKEGIYALNQHIFRVLPFLIDKNDLYWVLKAVTAHVEDQAHGIIGMVHVTKGDLGSIKVPVPTPAEQTAIATFLDRETAKIDALVAEQEKLIALLQEKRQAVISHAVTKGLDPNVPMKDSGVEWLGEVPKHWIVDRLKASIISSKNGIWGDESKGDENDIPCVRVADFDRQKLRVELKEPTIRNVTSREREGRTLNKGDLLLEKSGGGENQPVGCVVMYDDERPAVCSNFVARVQLAPGMVSSYWRYVHAAAYAVRLTTGSINQTSGIQNLDQDRYYNERAAFPPPEEQTAIAIFLDRETAKLDTLMTEARTAITLLQERRTALISAAVTGQIDVRGLVGGANAPDLVAPSAYPASAGA